MQYVGIEWAYRRAGWCAKQADGTIFGEGLVPADEDGLARLVIGLGPGVRACLEMMSGAVWVRDRLAGGGWRVEVADAQGRECRPARLQDRQGRRPRARRALPPLARARALDPVARGARHARAAEAPAPPRPSRDLGQEPPLRPAHPMGPQDPWRSPAPTRRDGAARDARCARGLAPLRWPRRSP